MKRRTGKTAIALLKKSFRKGETLVIALEKIKADMEINPRLQKILEAQWSIWELYGDEEEK